jgi:hypothetical protein
METLGIFVGRLDYFGLYATRRINIHKSLTVPCRMLVWDVAAVILLVRRGRGAASLQKSGTGRRVFRWQFISLIAHGTQSLTGSIATDESDGTRRPEASHHILN